MTREASDAKLTLGIFPSAFPPIFSVHVFPTDDGYVYTSKYSSLPASTRLGPLEGAVCEESRMDFDEDRSNVWLLYCEGGQRKCVSTTDADR